ncbi:glycosyl hydrolase family 28-related protein [Kribbella sp. NPDC058245]|uniref:glycosyl hydrolase family 28-related protein n=1 Tax=Kribbella sp. NPDC058245 TaxID=3346399 RepID=UPI0036E64AB9
MQPSRLLVCALLLAAQSVAVGNQARAATQAVGATLPFSTIEAESGTLGGTATIRRITPGTAVPTSATLELEASGYAYADLRSTGDSIAIRNTTNISANTLVVRASLPDAPNGGGITAPINLYVNGVLRQAITLSSTQAWNYRNSTTNPDDPHGGGQAIFLYNEFPVWVTGAPIAPGSSISLRKDTNSTAPSYAIDSVDFENVAPALTQPANSLSVISYGADPTTAKDSTTAIQTAVNDARTQGKTVWIPAGKYLTNSLAPNAALDFTGVKVQGAGMWHSILYRRVPLSPPPTSWRSQITVGSGTTVADLQVLGNAVYRGIGGGGGDDYGFNAGGSKGWLLDRIWTRHTDANWLSGTNGVVQNSRTGDTYGDGFNANNGNTPNPEKLGHYLTIRNNFARGTGDDAFATYSDAGASGTNGQMIGTKILNNTAVAPYWANGIRVAGGRDVEVRDNLVNTVSSNNAMDISVFGDSGHPLESATITGNTLIGGGGWNGVRTGVHIGSPGPTSRFPNAYTNFTMSNNVIRGSLRSGLMIDKTRIKGTLTDTTIDGPANQGTLIVGGVTGTGTFTRTVTRNLRPGQVAFQNDSPTTFTATIN